MGLIRARSCTNFIRAENICWLNHILVHQSYNLLSAQSRTQACRAVFRLQYALSTQHLSGRRREGWPRRWRSWWRWPCPVGRACRRRAQWSRRTDRRLWRLGARQDRRSDVEQRAIVSVVIDPHRVHAKAIGGLLLLVTNRVHIMQTESANNTRQTAAQQKNHVCRGEWGNIKEIRHCAALTNPDSSSNAGGRLPHHSVPPLPDTENRIEPSGTVFRLVSE
eukprot:SAG11_NODE_56_length_19295_cov_20.219675_7_plen_221_part_00